MDQSVPMHFRKDLSMLCILALLEQSGEMYGYSLVKAMGERSEGMFDLPEGTIYPVLYRLEEQGLVKQRAARVGKRMNRYYYSLTDAQDRAWQDALSADGMEWLNGYMVSGKAMTNAEAEQLNAFGQADAFKAAFHHFHVGYMVTGYVIAKVV